MSLFHFLGETMAAKQSSHHEMAKHHLKKANEHLMKAHKEHKETKRKEK